MWHYILFDFWSIVLNDPHPAGSYSFILSPYHWIIGGSIRNNNHNLVCMNHQMFNTLPFALETGQVSLDSTMNKYKYNPVCMWGRVCYTFQLSHLSFTFLLIYAINHSIKFYIEFDFLQHQRFLPNHLDPWEQSNVENPTMDVLESSGLVYQAKTEMFRC